MRTTTRALLSVVILAGATAQPSPDELELPRRLATFLDDGAWDASAEGGFRAIVLSHLADGCAQQAVVHPGRREAARRCVARALELGLRAPPLRHVETATDGLWLAHLNLVLGASHLVGDCADPRTHERLSRRLVALSLADPLRHAPSYGSAALRWPADQAALLASLARYDAGHGTALLERPLREWRAVVTTRGVDPATKLPRSELTGKGPGARHPRGCAQSFISRYLAEADAPLARAWWETYRDEWLVRVGTVAGFREWPPGVERAADVDSGPIVLGVGVAASALGIAAARAQGEPALAAQLEASAEAVGTSGLAGPVPYLLLPQAIRFEAKWQPSLVAE